MAPSAEPSVTMLIRISGRVQGVGYRMWAVATARALGLAGWVRNLTDGSVEVLVHGGPDAVAGFIQACHEGPMGGGVTSVETDPTEPFKGDGFEQRVTPRPTV